MTALLAYGAFIDGLSWTAATTFDVLDPSTGDALAQVARCGRDEVDAAVSSARAALESTWRRTLPADRGRILRRIADRIESERDALAELESRDTGKPLRQAQADVRVAARYFEFYGGAVESLYGATIPAISDGLAYTIREPWGVTAHIIPWNYPLQIGCRSVAPALAAGNCCVLKPAEEAPLTAVRLAEIAFECGVPAGALNVVTGLGPEVGAALAAHAGIDHLAFTGSPEVGVLVAKAAAENWVPTTLELGGKSPNIIFADADVDLAVEVAVASILQNAGQTCSAGSLLLVEHSVVNEVLTRAGEAMRAASIGPGIDDPDLGPLISGSQRDRVKALVDIGRREGQVVTGGCVAEVDAAPGGFYFEPTLVTSLAPTSATAREEIFGPVLVALPFADDDEALAIANDADYGLIAAVWTRDINRAHRMARDLRVGQVYVNTYGAGGGVELPFGGVKRSGHGREKGYEALLAYTQTKSVAIAFRG